MRGSRSLLVGRTGTTGRGSSMMSPRLWIRRQLSPAVRGLRRDIPGQLALQLVEDLPPVAPEPVRLPECHCRERRARPAARRPPDHAVVPFRSLAHRRRRSPRPRPVRRSPYGRAGGRSDRQPLSQGRLDRDELPAARLPWFVRTLTQQAFAIQERPRRSRSHWGCSCSCAR